MELAPGPLSLTGSFPCWRPPIQHNSSSGSGEDLKGTSCTVGQARLSYLLWKQEQALFLCDILRASPPRSNDCLLQRCLPARPASDKTTRTSRGIPEFKTDRAGPGTQAGGVAVRTDPQTGQWPQTGLAALGDFPQETRYVGHEARRTCLGAEQCLCLSRPA